MKTLNYACVEFPVKISDIHKIKSRNDKKLRVLEYHTETGRVNITYHSEAHRCDRTSNLLLTAWENGEHNLLRLPRPFSLVQLFRRRFLLYIDHKPLDY